MSEKNYSKFQIKNILFPRIEGLFISMPIGDFEFSYRVEGHVPSEKVVRLLFGIQVASKDKVEGKTAKASVIVEAIGEFEFEEELPVIDHISKLPLAANLLALLYPFIREKVSSFFASNGLQVFLPPTNTIQLVRDNQSNQNFKVLDARLKMGQIAEKAT